MGIGRIVPLEDDAEIFFFQGDALEPPCDPVNGREARPHTPGHSAELLAVPSVALADDLVEIRRPLDRVSWWKLCQPPLGNFEIFPVVHDVQEPVFQLIRVLPDNAIEIDEVAVGVGSTPTKRTSWRNCWTRATSHLRKPLMRRLPLWTRTPP